jgi:hypothetical protein
MNNDPFYSNHNADFQHTGLVRVSRLAAVVVRAAISGHKAHHDMAEALLQELEYLQLNFDLVRKK